MVVLPKPPSKWTISDVEVWLQFVGLEALYPAFSSCLSDSEKAAIDGSCLPSLTEEDLRNELEIKSSITTKKLMNCKFQWLCRDQRWPQGVQRVSLDDSARNDHERVPAIAAARPIEVSAGEGGVHRREARAAAVYNSREARTEAAVVADHPARGRPEEHLPHTQRGGRQHRKALHKSDNHPRGERVTASRAHRVQQRRVLHQGHWQHHRHVRQDHRQDGTATGTFWPTQGMIIEMGSNCY